jgi:hypothetical protein
VLRTAGFPVDGALAFACPRAVEATDRSIEAMHALDLRRAAVEAFVGRRSSTSAESVLRRIRGGRSIPGESASVFDPVDRSAWLEAAEAYNHALESSLAAAAEAGRAVDGDLASSRASLHRTVSGVRFREAVWTSSRSFSESLERYVAKGYARDRTTKERQTERTCLSFLQRFAAKNDMISFFGPTVWGRFASGAGSLAYVPRPGDVTSKRLASAEYWGMSDLARRISNDPDVRRVLVPRLHPSCRIEGAVLHHPIGKRTELSRRQLGVLRLVDGRRTHRAIAEAAGGDLDRLIEQGILSCELSVPTVLPNPERLLLERVEALPDECASKAAWVEHLRRIAAVIERYRDAPWEERRSLAKELDERFASLTGAEPTRAHGKTYAARTLIYEDRTRNVEGLVIGGALLEEIDALGPLYEIARWIAQDLALRYEGHFIRVSKNLGGPPFDFLELASVATGEESTGLEDGVARTLEDAWRRVLGDRIEGDPVEVFVTKEDAHRVLELLGPREGPALVGSDFHSPDILIGSSGVEAVDRGDFILVLGELHKSSSMVTKPSSWPLCPVKDEVVAFIAGAFEAPVLDFSDPPNAHLRSNRSWPDVAPFHEIITRAHTSRFPPERVVRVADLVVVEAEGHLFVETRDGRTRTWLPSVMFYDLYERHQKRIVIDPLPSIGGVRRPRYWFGRRTVAQRAKWVLPAAELPEVPERSSTAEVFTCVRRFVMKHGIPDLVFAKVPSEPKPVMIDFRSVLHAELFRKLIGDAPYVSLTEMLPRPDQIWLADAEGRRYVCELRATAIARRDRG